MKWLKRMANRRGFGVQSPTDYWLLTHVLRQGLPYYAYDELGDDPIGQLCLRLANHLQPTLIAVDEGAKVLIPWLHAGCKRAETTAFPAAGAQMTVVSQAPADLTWLPNGGMLVVTGKGGTIPKGPFITFEASHYAVIIRDDGRTPHHYYI